MADSKYSERSKGDRSLIIATAGHVDHGKTSLISHITGTDTDTLPEEKARGLSINLGYAYLHFTSPGADEPTQSTIGFVDVPGHIDFISNMLAGVGAVDAALLVVAADDGIMPQTREHIAILDLLGVEKLAVALTKIDRCDEQQIVTVQEEINSLLADTGFAATPIFRIANTTGSGVPLLVAHLKSWLEESTTSSELLSTQYARYLIDRCFVVKGIGTVVTGCARAGVLKVGETVLHTGTGATTKIKGLRLDQSPLDSLQRGQRAAANISLNHADIKRGDWLIDARLHQLVSRFDVRIRFIEKDQQLKGNAQYHLHIGASHHVVTLRNLDTENSSYFQIKTNEAIPVHFGDRFIIRDPAAQRTIAGGRVIDIHIPRRGRASSHRLEVLKAMDQDAGAAITNLLNILPEGLNLDQFALNRNLSVDAINTLLQTMARNQVPSVKLSQDKMVLPVLLHADTMAKYCSTIVEHLKNYHAANTNQQGISEPALSRAVSFDGSHKLFHSILHSMLQQSSVKRTGTLLHLPSHETALSNEEKEFLTKVRPILLKAGNVPPRTRELVELTGIPLKPLDSLLRQISKAGNLIKVAENRYYLPETIMALAEYAESLVANGLEEEGFTVIQFRDASGIGRNLCIEILEYFDKAGYTRRDGNNRFLRTDKNNVFGK